jgi:hypothetical protein
MKFQYVPPIEETMDAWIPLLGSNVYYKDLYEINSSSLRIRRLKKGQRVRSTSTGLVCLMGQWLHIANVVRDHRALRHLETEDDVEEPAEVETVRGGESPEVEPAEVETVRGGESPEVEPVGGGESAEVEPVGGGESAEVEHVGGGVEPVNECDTHFDAGVKEDSGSDCGDDQDVLEPERRGIIRLVSMGLLIKLSCLALLVAYVWSLEEDVKPLVWDDM